MADFNELCDLISIYKESYGGGVYDYSLDYNDYYTEATSDPAAEEFKSIVKSIKNNIKVCKNLIKKENAEDASKLITTMENDCNTLDGLVDKIKNPNALDTCGKVIIGVSALLGGIIGYVIKSEKDFKDADKFNNIRFAPNYDIDDPRLKDLNDRDSELTDRYLKFNRKYGCNYKHKWGFNNRHYKKYMKDNSDLEYDKSSISNSFYIPSCYAEEHNIKPGVKMSKDDYIKYLSKDNPNNHYVKALKQGKSLKQLQKSQNLGTAAHIGAGIGAGAAIGTIPALILKKRRNVHTLIAKLRKQINKLKVALSKIK